MSRQLVLTQEV